MPATNIVISLVPLYVPHSMAYIRPHKLYCVEMGSMNTFASVVVLHNMAIVQLQMAIVLGIPAFNCVHLLPVMTGNRSSTCRWSGCVLTLFVAITMSKVCML